MADALRYPPPPAMTDAVAHPPPQAALTAAGYEATDRLVPRLELPRAHPRTWWAAVIAAGAAVVAAALAGAALLPARDGTVSFAVAVGLTFAATGAVLLRSFRGRVAGRYLMLFGAVWPWTLGVLVPTGWAALVGYLLSTLVWFILLAAVLTYPADLPRSAAERVFLPAAGGVVVGLGWLLVPLSRPEWNSAPATASWPTLAADRPLFVALSMVWTAGCLAAATGVLVLLRRRLAALTGIDRQALFPALTGAAVAGFTAASSSALQVYLAMPDEWALLTNVQGGALLAVPAAATWAVTRIRRVSTDLLTRLPRSSATPAQVQQALAETLGDPSLTLSFLASEVGGYVDVEGRRTDPGATPPGRLLVPLFDENLVRWCVIDVAAVLRHHDEELEAVLRAAMFALHNARLQADLKAQLAEVRRSRAAIVAAREDGRRKLAHNLHDGTQATLLSIPLQLETLRMRTTDEDLRAALQQCKERASAAAAAIRQISEGLEPRTLRENGLRAAVCQLTSTLQVGFDTPIDVAVPAGRQRTAVETTAYYVIAEAATNAAKHARASRLTVRAAPIGDRLVVEVVDDGVGGADPAGHGLTGLSERARSLGGALTVRSPSGGGTWVRGDLPL